MPAAWSWGTWLTLPQGWPTVKRMFDTRLCGVPGPGIARPAGQGSITGQAQTFSLRC
jgi:hypothetical protein